MDFMGKTSNAYRIRWESSAENVYLEHQDGDGKVTNKYIKGRQIVRIRG